MKDKPKPLEIDIQPPVSVYATYRRLSYLPWYAIAEFVDNSTQNYYDHIHELKQVYKKESVKRLRIKIEYDREKNCLTISDNANGMDLSELERAIKLNRPPKNPSGRCEFGMGLKTAACWFGRKWSIETTRLGAEEKYTITLDVDEVSQQNSET
ncbi:MAG: ATP-binding protein, partial [Candidatus Marsarchaeota archaeon]|nr:ATP-binding protein [Candidatus Marsarchaeota archaeon]